MLFGEFLVADPRDNKLILTWLTAIDVIVGVEEGAIVNHERHLKALMYDRKISILVYFCDQDLLVIGW